MSPTEDHSPEGHRDRLRKRFQIDPDSLSDAEKLELLLTYAVPRKDMAPLASALLARFGSLAAIFAAPPPALLNVEGVGESTALFLQLIHHLAATPPEFEMSSKQTALPSPQLNLFEIAAAGPKTSAPGIPALPKERPMRVYANDEIANVLAFLPLAGAFTGLDAFRAYLQEKLPYNAADTRARRSSYILDRFYPEGQLDTPLTYYAGRCSDQADLAPAVFYHIIKAEPLAAKIAEELIWPMLPIGKVDRDQVRDLIVRHMPDTKPATHKKILHAIYHTYGLSRVGVVNGNTLRIQIRNGSLESFLYLLTCEYPTPGMYSFESLYAGPLHRWLLWDREWMRLQLYNLQDFGVISKVSEIDTLRQFTVASDQRSALQSFFEHPQRNTRAIRDATDEPGYPIPGQTN